MNAHESYLKTKEALISFKESRYKYVMEVIQLAIDAGEYSAFLSSIFIDKEIIEKLKKEGYTIKRDFFGDYTISWKI